MAVLLRVMDDLDRQLCNPYTDFGFGLSPHYIRSHCHQPKAKIITYTVPVKTSACPAKTSSCPAKNSACPAKTSSCPAKNSACPAKCSSCPVKCSSCPIGADDRKQCEPCGKDGYLVSMDVSEFKPNELNIKVVGNTVVIEGKHEEKEDNYGFISRHFVRRYVLPKEYDAEKLKTTLSADGLLVVSAPKFQPIETKSKERIVEIQQTGRAHYGSQASPKEEKIEVEEKK